MIETQARIRIAASPERVFDVAVAVETLPEVFVGYGPIPAIREAWLVDGPMREGAVRMVRNGDGSEIEEHIVGLERPRRQEYVLVSGFRPPFSWLVRRASGRWDFAPDRDGTLVSWRFTFEPTSPLAVPPLALLAHAFFRSAQRRCLERLAARVLNAAARSPHP